MRRIRQIWPDYPSIYLNCKRVVVYSHTCLWTDKSSCSVTFPLSCISIYFKTIRTHTTQKNIYSCGLNVLLDCSGHSTVEIICFFIMSVLKYHNIYKCIKAQICKLLQNAALFFLYFVSLCSDLMTSGNSFQTVAKRVPDNVCGGRSPFSTFLVILVLCGQVNRPPANGNSCPSISMPIGILAARDTALLY
jgi:hypothetical protein